MSTYEFDHPMTKRKEGGHAGKPPLQPMEFYFTALAKCPNCNFKEDVVINRDAEVYHECNQGNVRANVPTIKLPDEMIKHFHKEKLIDNLKLLEMKYDNKK